MTGPLPRTPRFARLLRTGSRTAQIALIALGVVLVLAIVIDVAADAPLRRRMERTLNESLEGYTARLGRLDFHVLGFGIDLEQLSIVQDEHPDPPVARIARLGASVEWRAIIFGRVVADIEVEEPVIAIDRAQLVAEERDPVPVEERGWQEAVQAIYPFRFDRVVIRDGAFSYRDNAEAKPLELRDVEVRAENIRNVHSRDRTYPSPVTIDAVVFDTGRLSVEGRADFLAAPHAGVRGAIRLDDARLDYFRPIAERYGVRIARGRLSAEGDIEYAPRVKRVRLGDVQVAGLAADWVTGAAETTVDRRVATARKVAEQASDSAPVELHLDRVRLTDAELGYQSDDPRYRVFLADTRFELRDYTNRKDAGASTAELEGRFLGEGPTKARGVFRAGRKSPEFTLTGRIDDAPLRKMNDVLRAYGGFDVAHGFLTVVTDVTVRDGLITGYVKPELRDVDVYTREQDEENNPLRQAYELVVGGIVEVFQNQPRDSVATRTSLYGRVENPQSSTIEILIGLVQNAFFKAVLPQFDPPRSAGAEPAPADDG
jgi:hypothetical protein